MDSLPTVAAPVSPSEPRPWPAAACELHDAASAPGSWSAAAVESMETTALALAASHPDAVVAMLTVGQQLAYLRA
ncbi:hypothetical protein ACFYN0_35180 [Streptomyces sp. NPDC006704]|uniref:hypothetical protein n=1 Tax=Streptomyces sp. NPDC006704 TaxID=3364760 RepID=UPI0036A47973